jgi:hypothetical protein
MIPDDLANKESALRHSQASLACSYENNANRRRSLRCFFPVIFRRDRRERWPEHGSNPVPAKERRPWEITYRGKCGNDIGDLDCMRTKRRRGWAVISLVASASRDKGGLSTGLLSLARKRKAEHSRNAAREENEATFSAARRLRKPSQPSYCSSRSRIAFAFALAERGKIGRVAAPYFSQEQ